MAKLFIFTLLIVALQQANCFFCDLGSCHTKHIDCVIGSDEWGPNCLPDRNMLDLRPVVNTIVQQHNEYRNQIAGGLVTGFEPAQRMGLMQWNVKLANLCRKQVRLCSTEGGLCANTPEFLFAGQNLAYRKYPKNQTTTNIAIIKDLIKTWYDEINNMNMDDIRVYSNSFNGAHASQILKSSATRVGCAVSSMTDATDRTVFLCCNYDHGNIVGWPTYNEGIAVSACTTGKDTTYKNLCSASEEFKINAFWEDF